METLRSKVSVNESCIPDLFCAAVPTASVQGCCKRILPFSDLSSEPSHKSTQLLFRGVVFPCCSQENTEWFGGNSVWNANLREMCSSTEAAPPPHGTARSALFLPGQLELDPKQQQNIAAHKKNLSGCSDSPRGSEPPGFLLLLWQTEVGRDGEHGQGVLDAAGIASASVTSCLQSLHSLCCGF